MNKRNPRRDRRETSTRRRPASFSGRTWLVLELVTLALTAVFLCSFLIQKRYRDVPMETITAAVSAGEGISEMIVEDRGGLRRSFGIDAAAVEGFFYCRSSSNMEADEILIVKTAGKEAAEALVPAAEARLKALHESFDHYGVSEVSKLNKAILAVRGRYLFFAVSDNAGDWEARFLTEVAE